MPFPLHRPRRLRSTEQIRSLVRETRLNPMQFILPLFVCPGEGVRREIGAMPGNYQLSIDQLIVECEEAQSLGVGGVILFGLPESKDEEASGGYASDGIVQRAIRALKKALPKLLVITDVCNCEYTSHGHCGTLTRTSAHPPSTGFAVFPLAVKKSKMFLRNIEPLFTGARARKPRSFLFATARNLFLRYTSRLHARIL